MKLYPWLQEYYKKIIQQHKIKKAHHAILIKTQRGIGVAKLIWFISKWLLCLKPIGENFCNTCHGCQLMYAKNHPDWHQFISEENNIFNINCVREINNKIFQRSQQGGAKIVFLSDTEKLTESGVNAFLKTLEEPPKNTWFFLINYNHLNLHATINSRCLIYKLFAPTEKYSLMWLKKEAKENNISHLTALRIHQGSPVSAKKFINGELWNDRINFYKNLHNAFKDKDLLKMLPNLHKKNSTIKILWISLLLLDAIKLHFNEQKYLTNLDQINLIIFFSNNYTISCLDNSIRTWMRCRYRLLNISGVNHELLLIEQLLTWEKISNFVFTS